MTTTNLTTTQETVLKAAALRPDGHLHPLPKHLKGGSALKVITALEKECLIEDAAINPPYKTWMISDQGYRAIGQEPPKPEQKETPEPEEMPEPETTIESAETPEPETTIESAETPEPETTIESTETHEPETTIESTETPEPETTIESDEILEQETLIESAETPEPETKTESEETPVPEATTESAEAPDINPTRKTRTGTKQAKVIEMLKRPEGATIEQIASETEWKNHTVRGFFAGTIKKKMGLELIRQKTAIDNADGSKTISTYHLAG